MITSHVGAVFVKAYNDRYGTDYDGRRFFTEVFHPLFFDHEKYMFWPSNSPFVQGVKKGKSFTAAERAEKLQTLHQNIAQVTTLSDASIALGYPAAGLTGTTSGQVTGMALPLTGEDAYLSWIGAALSVGVKGGLSLLFARPEILLAVYEGWRYYRELLNGVPQSEPNKIMTWNGCWILHRFGADFDPKRPLHNFMPHETVSRGEKTGFDTVGWAEIMQVIARQFSGERLMGYVWGLGQTNTTIGFIPFELPEIVRPLDFYIRMFGMDSAKAARALYGTAVGFERCCQRGCIGVQAMEPKGLRDIMTGRKALKYKPDDADNRIQFQTYITWILAMLNNEQLRDVARDLAQELRTYVQESKQGKNDRENHVKTILETRNRSTFNDQILPVVRELGDQSKLYDAYTKINGGMSVDNVPYFLGLLRVEYAVL